MRLSNDINRPTGRVSLNAPGSRSNSTRPNHIANNTMTIQHLARKTNHAVAPRVNRRAVATVELAVCLPVLALLVLGSIEAASFIFLKQTLQVAAYEGSVRAGRARSTSEMSGDETTSA